MPDALAADTRRALAHIARQLEGYEDALRGLCIRGESVQTRHGRFGPPSSREAIDQRVDELETVTNEVQDLLPFLDGEGFERTEATLSDGTRAVRVIPTGPTEGEIVGADFVVQTEPPRLLRASLHPPRLPRLAGWLVDTLTTELAFETVRGVPLVTEMHMRMRSRGIGRLRLDHETAMTVRYEPCD